MAEVTMSFGGVELSPYLRIIDVRRPIGNPRDVSTNDAPSLGVNVQRVKLGAKTIEVDVQLMTKDGRTMEQRKHELAKILNVSKPVKIKFSDEPDKYYLGLPVDDIEPKNVTSWLQKFTLELLIPDGVAHATTYKRVTSAQAQVKADRVVFTLDNAGSVNARPIIRLKHNSENGYLGFVNSTGALEIGNPEDADTETVRSSEMLLDYRDSKVTAGLAAATPNQAILNDTSQRLGGSVKSSTVWGRPHLELNTRGGTTGNNAATLTWNIPADSTGEAGSLNDYIWWRQIFWLGAANQYGFIKLTVSDTNGKFLYGVETFKRGNGLGCEYNFMASDGKGGYNILRRWTFTGTHVDSQNPFNEPRGWSDLRRNDDKVTVFWWGSYIPITIPEIKGRRSAKIHVAFGTIGNKPLVTHMYLDGLLYVKDYVPKVQNIPNIFQPGYTVEVNSENDTAKINGLDVANRVVHGSEWIEIPPGQSTLEVFFSSWQQTKPDITIEFEERWL